jgi:WD40 repeat protein
MTVRASRVPTDCLGAALAPDGGRRVCVGYGGVWLTSSFDSRGRWLAEEARFNYYSEAIAWDRSGRRVAAGGTYVVTGSNALMVFDLEAGTDRTLSLVPPGETGQGYDWGVLDLAFTPEGRLVVGGTGGVRWVDPETGASTWIWRLPQGVSAPVAMSADGRHLAAAAQQSLSASARKPAPAHGVVLVDLPAGAPRPLLSHSRAVTAVALDAAGRTIVTGDEEGALRAGSWEGGEPHRLCCHAGAVRAVAVSPDGKWIASASGGEIRLWPMPDITKPPLHTLPYDELMAKLRALTNLQVVEDAASPTGYKLDIGPFPGWRDVPSW